MFPVCYVGSDLYLGPGSLCLPFITFASPQLCISTSSSPKTSESMVFKRRENSDGTVEICLCSCTTHSNHLKQKFKKHGKSLWCQIQCEHLSPLQGGFIKKLKKNKNTSFTNVDVQNKSQESPTLSGCEEGCGQVFRSLQSHVKTSC